MVKTQGQSQDEPAQREVGTLGVLLVARWSEGRDLPRYTLLDARRRATELTLSALRGRAMAVAEKLRAQGVGPGDRVLLAYPPDGLEFVVGMAACLLIGSIFVPVQVPAPGRLREDLPRLSHIAEDCGAKVALTTSAYRALTRVAKVQSWIAEATRQAELVWPRLTWLATDGLAPVEGAVSPPDVAPEDVAYLQYTSGSTERPRGVCITHANALHNLRLIAAETEVDENSVLVGWVPLYHDMGLVGGILNILYARAHLVFFSPLHFLRDPELWNDAIERYGGTHIASPDFGLQYWMSKVPAQRWARSDLSTLRFVLQGGEVARAATVDRAKEVLGSSGVPADAFNNVYGMAETALYACGRTRGAVTLLPVSATAIERDRVEVVEPDHPEARRLVSCGAPAPGVQLAIVAEGQVLPEGHVGELHLSGASVARGYWGRPDAENAAQFSRRLDAFPELRFYGTGDLGFLRDGELYLCGRAKELVIIGGRNLYPHDLEQSAIASHPAFRKGCAVAFSLDDGSHELLVMAMEVKDATMDAERCRRELAPAVRAALASAHRVAPERLLFLKPNTLPKTSSGKLQRGRARARYREGALPTITQISAGPARSLAKVAARPDSAATVLAWIAEDLVDLLGERREVLPLERTFAELGVDSIHGARLSQRMADRLGMPLPASLWMTRDSPQAVAEGVMALLERGAASLPAPSGVRVAVEADLPRIEAYLTLPEVDQSFQMPLSERPESIAARVADRSRRGVWLLAEESGVLRACVALVEHPQQMVELSTLSVHPEARNFGIAHALLDAVLTAAHGRFAARVLTTDSWAGNERSAAALRALGFEEVARYPDPAKRPPGVDTVLYRRALVDDPAPLGERPVARGLAARCSALARRMLPARRRDRALLGLGGLLLLGFASVLVPVLRYVVSTPPYQRHLGDAEAGSRLVIADIDALPAPDAADPDLYHRRLRTVATFFDAYNCSNYELLGQTLADRDLFHYSVTTFPDDYIGFHDSVEYLVIGNPQATLGRTTLHLLPQRPAVPTQRRDAHGETLALPLRLVLDMRGAERMQGDGVLEVTFEPGSDKLSRMFLDIPDAASELIGDALQKADAREFICRSMHDPVFNAKMYSASLFFEPENEACPNYARGAESVRPKPFERLCEGHVDPRDGGPLLGSSYAQCMDILGDVPIMDGSYTRSAGVDTVACRALHGIAARLNPGHHCMHLQVPSVGVDASGRVGVGPCDERPAVAGHSTHGGAR